MNSKEKDSMRSRRILWPCNDGTANVFELPGNDMVFKKILREWLATHSTGRFYLGHNVLCLYSRKDATAFKMFDVIAKCKVEYELKKISVPS